LLAIISWGQTATREIVRRPAVGGARVTTSSVASITAERGSKAAIAHTRDLQVSAITLPLHFEANQGQAGTGVRFVSRGPGYTIYLGQEEAILAVRSSNSGAAVSKSEPQLIRLQIAGARRSASVMAEEPLPGKANYLIGQDRAQWRTGIPLFGRVRYQQIYRGIDLVYYGNQRQLEHDFVVAPGADPKQIRIRIQGSRQPRLNRSGEVLISAGDGNVVMKAPYLYQEVGSARREIHGRYVLRAGNEVGFDIGAYDRRLPLVIDPVLVYSTYLGGSAPEFATGIAVDSSGNAYVTGSTASVNFPVVGAYQGTCGGTCSPNTEDIFIAKINPAGSALVYSTYLGGSGEDRASAIAVDTAGDAFITGVTYSSDFPTSSAIQGTLGSAGGNAFAVALNAAGSGLLYSTYLGGSSSDSGLAVAATGSGNAYISGITSSTDFPTLAQVMGPVTDKLFRSVDFAGSWTSTASEISSMFITALAVDPSNHLTVYAATAGGGLFKSLDSGATWSATPAGAMKGNSNAIAIDASGVVYLGKAGGGVARSADGGATATTVNAGLTNRFVLALAIDPVTPATVYAGTNGGGVFKTTNSGGSWVAVNSGLPSNGMIIQGLAIDPITPATLYAATNGAGVYKSTDGGSTWAAVISGLTNLQVRRVVVDPVTPATVYAVCTAGAGGLFKSSDGGTSWSLVSASIPSPNLRALVIDPSNTQVLYTAGSGSVGVYKSSDGGNNWFSVSSGMTFTYAFALAIDPVTPSNLYVGMVSQEAFLTEIASTGSLVFSTYYGAPGGSTSANAVAVNGSGEIYIAGATGTPNLPGTSGGLQPALPSFNSGFIAKFSSGGDGIANATYLGGDLPTSINAIALDGSSNVYVGGDTAATNLPAGGAFQANLAGAQDGFIARFDSSLLEFLYGTYLGGANANESVTGIAVDTNGLVSIVGHTDSVDFPVVNATQPTSGGGIDAFFAQIDPSVAGTNSLVFSTYLGGAGNEFGRAVALDSTGNAYITGQTSSTDFPTNAALQGSFGGAADAFITKIRHTAFSDDMSVDATASPQAIAPAANVSYTITVVNNGGDPSGANNVRLTAVLPAGATLQSGSPITTTVGTCSGTSTISCDLGLMTPSSTATITIGIIAPATAGNLLLRATVRSDDNDPNPANNSKSLLTPVTACVTSAPGGYVVWTGNQDTNWITPENWSTGAVPVPSDDVYVCSQALNQPAITTGGSARNVLVGAGASIAISGVETQLQAAGNVTATGPITGSGALSMTGAGVTLQGAVGTTYIYGTVTLAADTAFTGDLAIFSGAFDLGGHTATVSQNLHVYAGVPVMQHPADKLTVLGSAYFDYSGDTTGMLTSGVMELAGDLSVCCGSLQFVPSGTHLTKLIGSNTQNIYFYPAGFTDNRFQDLLINKTGGSVQISYSAYVSGNLTLNSATPLTGSYLYVAGAITTVAGSSITPYQLHVLGTLAATGSIFPSYLYFDGITPQALQGSYGAAYSTYIYSNATLAGDTTFAGSLYLDGTLDLNTHTATVLSDFVTENNGGLLMTHSADKLKVGGGASFYGTNTVPTSILTAGTLEVSGEFNESAVQSFVASGTHLTRFVGTSGQDLYMYGSGNHFQDLEIANFSSSGVYVGGTIKIAGQLIKHAGKLSYVNSGSGGYFDTAGVNVNGLVLNDAPVTIGAGVITAFDNVTFQNFSPNRNQLTINNPGAATPYTFSGLRFFTIPTSGYYYVVANDTAADANTLTVNLVSAYPADGSTATLTGGIGGTATLTADAVTSVNVTNGGSGYSTPPAVTFVGGGGTGATGTAVLTGGVVTDVTVTYGGSSYTSAPAVVISGVPGSAVVNWTTLPLLHWYTFQGNANDQIGTANGTLVGGAAASAGLLSLDGSSGYVQFGSQIVPTSGSYSVTMFATETAASSAIAELISQGQTGGGFYIGHDAGGQVRVGDAWTSTGVPFPADGLQHHYALVMDASANLAQLYIDGALAATHAAFTTNAGDNTKLGSQYFAAGEFFHGNLADVRVYQGALTASEVAFVATGQDQGADVSVSFSQNYPNPTAVAPGGTVYYYLNVKNAGPSLAPSVSLQLTIPADAVVAYSSVSCTGSAPTLTCALGNIDSGSSNYYNFYLQLSTLGQNVVTAKATSNLVDPNLDNNSVTAAVTVSNTITDLNLHMTAPASVAPGVNATFNLTVYNGGPLDATGVVLTQTLPAGFTFVSASGDGTCSGTSIVTCTLNSTLTYGVSATVQITATAGAAGLYLTTASVSANEADSYIYNNQAIAQIFVTIYGFGVIERESLDVNNAEVLYGYGEEPSISFTGRFVAFDAYAPFFTGDTNSTYDVYLRDNCRGAAAGCTPSTIPISVDASGNAGNNESYWGSVNRSGRYVAFYSYADNLVAGDTNGNSDIFVRDTCIGAPAGCTPSTTIVSVATDGTQSDDNSGEEGPPAISATGRYIAFDSYANTLTPQGSADYYDQVVLRDTCIGAPAGCTPSTILISANSAGAAPSDDSYHPSISADGRYVVFESYATDIVQGVTSNKHIYLRDTCIGATGPCTPTTTLVDAGLDGGPGNDYSYNPSTSATGRFIAFESYADNLVLNDANGDTEDVFVRDTCIGAPVGCVPKTVLVSVSSTGEQGNSSSYLAYDYASPQTISDNGRIVTFLSSAGNLVPAGNSSESSQQYVRDTCLGVTGTCSPKTMMVETTVDGNPPSNGIDYWGAISGDGSAVAFDSYADNLVANDTNLSSDVFLAITGFAPSSVGPDLAVAISGPASPVLQTNTFSYTVTVTNNGPTTANATTLTDALPSAVVFVSATPSQGSCTGSTTLTCNLGTLGNGISTTVTITVTASTPGLVANTVTVSSADIDPDASNNTATVNVQINPVADVMVSMVVSANPVAPGTTIFFTVLVNNLGPSAATGAVVSMTLPAGLTFAGVSPGPYTCSGSSIITCALGTIPNGGTVQLAVMAHVDAVGSYTSTATVTANETDPQLSNNSASATVNAIAADVEVVSLGTTSMLAGVPAYTVNVINHGPSTASAVVLTDKLDRFVYVASSTTQGSCSFASSTVTCPIGSLASGASATVVVAVSAPSRGWAAHDFDASASTPDPNPNNNTAHIGPSYDSFNTFVGTNVTVRLDSAGVEVVYSSVDRVGATAVSMMSPGSMPPPPAGFRAGNPAVVYDVSSSALFSGPVALTFSFQASTFHKPAKIRLFHLENGVWVDCSTALDVTGRITGRTTSLSPFALFEPLNTTPVANAGTARILPATAASGVTVRLDASLSNDADGDALNYRWSGAFPEGSGVVSGVNPNVTLPMGTARLTLVVNDGEVDSAPALVDVTVSDFALAVNGNSTIARGQSASYAVAVTPVFGAFDGPVVLACGNLPAGMNCSFSPASVTPGQAGTNSTLTITTTVASSRPRAPLFAFWLAIMLGPIGLAWSGRNRRAALLLLLMVIVIAAVGVGCGGGGTAPVTANTTTTTPAQAVTITVTGTSSGLQHSATATLLLK
jgi:uncharacterized repeat protein (TIGR01451 family)